MSLEEALSTRFVFVDSKVETPTFALRDSRAAGAYAPLPNSSVQ